MKQVQNHVCVDGSLINLLLILSLTAPSHLYWNLQSSLADKLKSWCFLMITFLLQPVTNILSNGVNSRPWKAERETELISEKLRVLSQINYLRVLTLESLSILSQISIYMTQYAKELIIVSGYNWKAGWQKSVCFQIFCRMDPLIITAGVCIYLKDEHISRSYVVFCISGNAQNHSSCLLNVWTIPATESFSIIFSLSASFILATQKIPVNLCKLFLREGVLLLGIKYFWVCLENSVKL